MRCIYCNTDNNYKTRQEHSGKCSQCHRAFAFEPQQDWLGVTDKKFQNKILAVSSNGKLHFTERQLWYEYKRSKDWHKWFKPILAIFIGFIMLTIITAVMGSALAWVLGCGVLIMLFFLVLIFREERSLAVHGTASVGPSFERFHDQYISRWETAHGHIQGLVTASSDTPMDLAQREPDLTAYSFDRVVVTDNSDVARMLVANSFHFENNCAIMSKNYPPGMTDTLLTMLRRNPELQVFALHDASANGCELPIALRKTDWFPDATMNVFDTGLRPRQAQGLKLPQLGGARRALSNELRAMLKADEITLLENGSAFELEALRPSKLIRTLYKYFNQARKSDASIAAETGVGLAPIFFLELGGGADGGDADGDAGDGADSFG